MKLNADETPNITFQAINLSLTFSSTKLAISGARKPFEQPNVLVRPKMLPDNWPANSAVIGLSPAQTIPLPNMARKISRTSKSRSSFLTVIRNRQMVGTNIEIDWKSLRTLVRLINFALISMSDSLRQSTFEMSMPANGAALYRPFSLIGMSNTSLR